METSTTTKTCQGCGKTLPLDAFAKHNQSEDGHMNTCKECRRRRSKPAPKSNPLEKFTARELMAELKQRGYCGTLEYTQTHIIDLSKI